MKIIVGHTNMDLDCLGSMVLIRYLYPEHVPIKSRLIHPVAKNLYNLYKNHLSFMESKELAEKDVEHIVVVDTRSKNRVKEYFEYMPDFHGEIVVFDHHPADSTDIPGAQFHEGAFGSNTTMIAMKLLVDGITITPEDATIALTGIYADTGNFTHDDVSHADFMVASYLIEQGASLRLVRNFLKSLREDHQISLFHDILNSLIYRDMNGHQVLFSYKELDHQIGGLAAVAEKVFEVEDADAFFAVFYFLKEKTAIIIGRSRTDDIPLNVLLKKFGGGGHPQASSALVKKCNGDEVFERLEEHLMEVLEPAVSAVEIMTHDVQVMKETWTLLEASKFLETINHTGAPVVNDNEELVGFLSLRDIMKGRKVDQMHAPVKAFMSHKVYSGTETMTLREIEDVLYENNIGHLPIIKDDKVVGLVTRNDYLEYISQE